MAKVFKPVSDFVFQPVIGEDAGVFSPPNITNLFAWYDPTDASSISESGGLVSTLGDKSGNGHSLDATGGERPETGVLTINGLNALDFDGTASQLSRGNIVYSSDDLTLLMVLRPIAAANVNSACFSMNLGNDFQIDANSTSAFFARMNDQGLGIGTIQSSADLLGSDSLIIYRLDGTGFTTQLRINGSADAAVGYTGGLASTKTLLVGTNRGEAQFLSMAMGEYILYDRALSALEITELETYLIDKWGI